MTTNRTRSLRRAKETIVTKNGDRLYFKITLPDLSGSHAQGKVSRDWFGEGSNVPLKTSMFTTARSFAAVKQVNSLKVVTFPLPFAAFDE